MANELLDIANLIYFLRFRVVWRLGCVKNAFARTFARFARFARTLPTPPLTAKPERNLPASGVFQSYTFIHSVCCYTRYYLRPDGI
jgi:hypothetical protein